MSESAQLSAFDPLARRILTPDRPANFREAQAIEHAAFRVRTPAFAAKKRRLTGARAAGVRYEKKIHEEFIRRFPKHYLPSPWFEFWDVHGRRWCQPDGLIIDAVQGLIVIVEVKHHHTGEAWWKLHKLYLPVVRKFFGTNWEYRCLEVVRFYDPHTIFPESRLLAHVHLIPPLPTIGVHICKPTA